MNDLAHASSPNPEVPVPASFVPASLIAASSARATAWAGWILIIFALLAVVFMAMHPTAGTHDAGEFVTRVGRGVPGNTLVHGSLVTIIVVMAGCTLWLRDLLGSHRPTVRAAMLCVVVGTAGAVVAGLINGFIVPNVSARYVGASAAEIEMLKPVLHFARECNATCARVSVVGLSLASVLWSVVLIGLGGWRRAIGVAGIACGVAPLLIHAGEHMQMDVPGYGLFVVIHGIWSILAGVVMIVCRRGA